MEGRERFDRVEIIFDARVVPISIAAVARRHCGGSSEGNSGSGGSDGDSSGGGRSSRRRRCPPQNAVCLTAMTINAREGARSFCVMTTAKRRR